MTVRVANQTGGGFQFIVTGENEVERLLIQRFIEETNEDGRVFCLHGYGGCIDYAGYESFNFGTRKSTVATPAAGDDRTAVPGSEMKESGSETKKGPAADTIGGEERG